MATTKLIPASKPIFKIKLLAGKNIVMVESDGYESEIFVPNIQNGRICFVNVIENRRCCTFTNAISEKSKLMIPISTDINRMPANKLQTIAIRNRLRISSGQEQTRPQKLIASPLQLHKELVDGTNVCCTKLNPNNRNRSYIIENAKIAEQFRNAVATRRQALALVLNKHSHSNEITRANCKFPIAENLKKQVILNNKSFTMYPIVRRALQADSNKVVKNSPESVKKSVGSCNATSGHVTKAENTQTSYKVSSRHNLKCANKSHLRKRKESDNKKLSQSCRQTKRHFQCSRESSQMSKA